MSTELAFAIRPELLTAFALSEVLQVSLQAVRKRMDKMPRETGATGLIAWRFNHLPAEWQQRLTMAMTAKGCESVDELLSCRRHSASQFEFSIEQATDHEKILWPIRKETILEFYRVFGFEGRKDIAETRAVRIFEQRTHTPLSVRQLRRWVAVVESCGGAEHAPDEAYVLWGKRRTLAGVPRETIEYFNSLLLGNQRKFRPAWRKLVEQLRKWRETGDKQYRIPGYSEPPKNAPGSDLPLRWSYKYFIDKRRRPAAPVIAGARYGLSAMKELTPVVRTTRLGLKVGQIYYPDDNQYDVKLNVLGINTRAMRPLGLNAVDHASDCIFANFFKPSVYDDEERAKRMLKQRDMIWFHVHLLTHYGYRTDADGTEIHAEKGTAGYPQWLIDNTKVVTSGKVIVKSGNIGGKEAFPGQFEGAAKGNPRFKALMESAFNPIRNNMADMDVFPGAVGMNRDKSPEQIHGMDRYNNLLLKVWAGLDEERRARLIFPYKEWRDFPSLALDVIEAINRDIEHDCAQWAECGYTLSEWRHDDDAPWKSVEEYLAMPELQRGALAAYLECNPHLTRVRKMSRREVFERGRRELSTLPIWMVPQLLSHQDAPDLSVMRRVNGDGLFHFQDQEADPYGGDFVFLARLHDRSGHEVRLIHGEKYKTFLNPLDPSCLLVCQPNGAYLGACPAIEAPVANDVKGVGKLLQLHKELMKENQSDLARLGIERTREMARMKMHNEGVVANQGTKERKAQIDEATDAVANLYAD